MPCVWSQKRSAMGSEARLSASSDGIAFRDRRPPRGWAVAAGNAHPANGVRGPYLKRRLASVFAIIRPVRSSAKLRSEPDVTLNGNPLLAATQTSEQAQEVTFHNLPTRLAKSCFARRDRSGQHKNLA